MVAWMRRISARSGLNVGTAMPCARPDRPADPGHPRSTRITDQPSSALPSLQWKVAASDFRLGATPRICCAGCVSSPSSRRRTVQEAQREQFATLTLNTAVELTSAALAQIAARRANRRTGRRDARRHACALPRGGRARERRPRGSSCAKHAKMLDPTGHIWLSSPQVIHRAIVRLLPAVPRRSCADSRRATSPGRRSRMRSSVVRRLNAKGEIATVDVLGEEITECREARRSPEYRGVLARIDAGALEANVSVKLTGSGPARAGPLSREPRRGASRGGGARSFVRIDMERLSTTDRTLALYRGCARRDTEYRRGAPVESASERSPTCGARERSPLQGPRDTSPLPPPQRPHQPRHPKLRHNSKPPAPQLP